MNRNELKKLLLAASAGGAYGEFSIGDIDSAVTNSLKDYLNIDDKRMRRLSVEDYAIIEEVIEEVTPKAVEDVIGQFAEVRTFDRQEMPLFTVRNLGGARVMRAIVPGARAGIYQARRLDNQHLMVDTFVETVGYALSLEDILTGRVTMREYVDLITRGFVELVYQRMIQALRAAAADAPEGNQAEASNDAEALGAGLDKVLRVVAAYGIPTIFAFESVASELANNLGSGFPANGYVAQDAADIREYGRIMKYKGRSVVVLPNFLTDNSNTAWFFEEDMVFILPANEKPVKVAFHGNLWVEDNKIPSGGIEYFAHREMGVAIIANQAVGSVTITD